MDASVDNTTYLTERVSLQLRLEAFNVINHTNFAPPIDNQSVLDENGLPVPGAGQIYSTQTPARQLQLGAKLVF